MKKNLLFFILFYFLTLTAINAQHREINDANYQCPSRFTVKSGEEVVINGNLIISAPDYVTVQNNGTLIIKGNIVIYGMRNQIHGNPHNFHKGTPANIINSGTVLIGGDVELHDDVDYEARGNGASLAVLGEYINAYGSSSSHGWQHVTNEIHGTPGNHNFVGEKVQFNSLAQRFFGGGRPGTTPPTRLTKENANLVPDNLANLIKTNFPNSQSSAALPIELVSFEGTIEDDKVILTWITATEINNSHFTIEKSMTAGRDYEIIEEKIKGAGNSDETIEYTFEDEKIKDGRIYYRLTQYDLDGKSESWVTIINYHDDSKKTEVISVYPDPADYNLNLIIHHQENPQFTYRLIHVEDGTVTELKPLQPMINEKVTFDISLLPAGAYVIEVANHGKTFHKSELLIKH